MVGFFFLCLFFFAFFCFVLFRLTFQHIATFDLINYDLLNHLHPNISMHILFTVLYTIPKVLTWRICLLIKRFFCQ